MSLLVWLSFCDPERPAGSQFLGACMVRIPDVGTPTDQCRAATALATLAGCNPGGEIEATIVTPAGAARVPDKWIGRLLQRAEIDAFDREMGY